MERRQRRVEHALNGKHAVTDTEQARLLLRVIDAHLRRVTRRHHDRVNSLGAERVDSDCQRECRIHAARQSHHYAGKAVLVDVIPHAEHQRRIHTRFVAELRGNLPHRGYDLSPMPHEIDRVNAFLERRRAHDDTAFRIHDE